MEYEEKLAAAQASHRVAMNRVATTPEPDGQKFPVGSRVRIADDLGECMSHFPSGMEATIGFTYAHAFAHSRNDARSKRQYSLIFDGGGTVAWYNERQLTAVPSQVTLDKSE